MGMLKTSCHVEAVCDAPIAVWTLVTDVTRTGEWSHETQRAIWITGFTTCDFRECFDVEKTQSGRASVRLEFESERHAVLSLH